MQCERCKVNPATVHVTTIRDGKKVEMYLCDKCAKETENLYMNQFSFEDFLKGLLNITQSQQDLSSVQTRDNVMCPMCHMTYEQFCKTGKFGCANCYNTFAKALEPIFKRIHGNTVHSGKLPLKAAGKLKVKREINTLKQQLQEVIKREEFEAAAEIRDKIRALERGESNNEQ